MTFKSGQPRPLNAGRKKGSKNKRTLHKAKEILAEKNLNPVEEILRLIPLLTPSLQLEAWKYLLLFCEPKKKQLQSEEENPTEDITETNSADILSIITNPNNKNE